MLTETEARELQDELRHYSNALMSLMAALAKKSPVNIDRSMVINKLDNLVKRAARQQAEFLNQGDQLIANICAREIDALVRLIELFNEADFEAFGSQRAKEVNARCAKLLAFVAKANSALQEKIIRQTAVSRLAGAGARA